MIANEWLRSLVPDEYVYTGISNIISLISYLAEATSKKKGLGFSILRGNLGEFNVLIAIWNDEFRLQYQAWKKFLGQLHPSTSPHVPCKKLNGLKCSARQIRYKNKC